MHNMVSPYQQYKNSGDVPGNLTSATYYNGQWQTYQPINYGWVCPRCGRVWSPSMPCCSCKPGLVVDASTADTLPVSEVDLEAMANDPDIQREMKEIREEFDK